MTRYLLPLERWLAAAELETVGRSGDWHNTVRSTSDNIFARHCGIAATDLAWLAVCCWLVEWAGWWLRRSCQ